MTNSNKNPHLQLDYSIPTAKERCQISHTLPLESYTPTQLEKVANYILFGKTEDGKALKLAKQIETKKSTYKRKSDNSLEELMEKPTFHEADVSTELKRSIYLNPKPTVSRKTDGDIPNMVELWETIDQVKALHEAEEDGLKKYYLKHALIDLRKEQYYLKDLFKPTINFLNPLKTPVTEWDWFANSGYAKEPFDFTMQNGVPTYTGEKDWEWVDLCEHTLDFTNKDHIYHLLNNYSALRQHFYDEPWAQMNIILDMLENLIEDTPLSRPHKHILIKKIDQEFNEVIAQELLDNFEVHYGVNYISTVWKHTICGKIANFAKLREELKPSIKDKKCIQCHKRKPRTTDFFRRNSRKPDGLNSTCIKCELIYPPNTKFPVRAGNGLMSSELNKKKRKINYNLTDSHTPAELWKKKQWDKERGQSKKNNPLDDIICTDSVLAWLKKQKYN